MELCLDLSGVVDVSLAGNDDGAVASGPVRVADEGGGAVLHVDDPAAAVGDATAAVRRFVEQRFGWSAANANELLLRQLAGHAGTEALGATGIESGDELTVCLTDSGAARVELRHLGVFTRYLQYGADGCVSGMVEGFKATPVDEMRRIAQEGYPEDLMPLASLLLRSQYLTERQVMEHLCRAIYDLDTRILTFVLSHHESAQLLDLRKEGTPTQLALTPLALLLGRAEELWHVIEEERALACLDLLLAHPTVDLNRVSERGYTVAANHVGCLPLLKALVERGADVNMDRGRSAERSSPLMRAASLGLVEATGYLVEKGADIRWRNGYGRTAAHCAAENGCVYLLPLLVEDTRSSQPPPPHDSALLTFRDLFPQKRSGVDTPLHRAAARNNETFVEALLDIVAATAGDAFASAVNMPGSQGRTALVLAALQGNTAVCKLLVERGADPSLADDDDRTACSYATQPDTREYLSVFACPADEGAAEDDEPFNLFDE